jgi:hypothetical protein
VHSKRPVWHALARCAPTVRPRVIEVLKYPCDVSCLFILKSNEAIVKRGLGFLLSGVLAALWPATIIASSSSSGSGPIKARDMGGARAIKANDFLDSLGAVTHIIQGIDSPTAVEAGIRYLGIHNIRDDGTTDKKLLDTLCAIHRSTRAMIDELSLSDLAATRAQWDRLAACHALIAAEGPNEPNNFGFSYDGNRCSYEHKFGTFLPCAQFQRALYSMVHRDQKLAGIPVWGMTEIGAEPDNVGLQWLRIPKGSHALMPDGTQYADVANAHNYVQGHGSAGLLLEDNQAFWAESVDRGGTCAGYFDVYGEYWGGAGGSTDQGTWAKGYPINVLGQNDLPKVTTETGWNITNTPLVSADAQGKLLTDVYLQAYKQGWSKTFIYLMFNNSIGDKGFGMLDSPGHPTPLGRYVHNLTRILVDNSSAFTPGTVNYTISGMPSTGYDLLMQKSNGNYYLVVWDEAFGSKKSSTVTVSVGGAYRVKVYDITRSTMPVSELGDVNAFHLTILDHAQVVEFEIKAPLH